jgi:hypothetical protein
MESEMDAKERILVEAINRLNAIGARFQIRTPDGFEFTSQLPLFEPVVKKRRTRTNHPDMPKNKPYLDGLLKDVQPGNAITLPMQEGDDIKRFARNVCAYCSANWGTGDTYTTEANHLEKTVTVYRF